MTTENLPTGPLVDWTPGLAYPVSIDATLEDGTSLHAPTWVMVWDYEEGDDWRTARALITQASLDKKGAPLSDGDPVWAIITQGDGFRVSDSLIYRFTAGDRLPIAYKARDPKSNSVEIMQETYRAQVERRSAGGKLTTRAVAERLGIKGATWRAYVTRGQAPQPDGHIDARTPYWTSATIDEWKDHRPSAE